MNKFSADYELTYGSMLDFNEGLEGRIGSPEKNFFEAMGREHTNSVDSTVDFTSSNYFITTT